MTYTKEYYKKNKKKIKHNAILWRKNNRDSFILNRRAYRKKLRDLCKEIKYINRCAICNEDSVSCLDYHHINGKDKEDAISKMASEGRRGEMLKEIKKCMILCANHHRQYHANVITIPSNYIIKIPQNELYSRV